MEMPTKPRPASFKLKLVSICHTLIYIRFGNIARLHCHDLGTVLELMVPSKFWSGGFLTIALGSCALVPNRQNCAKWLFQLIVTSGRCRRALYTAGSFFKTKNFPDLPFFMIMAPSSTRNIMAAHTTKGKSQDVFQTIVNSRKSYKMMKGNTEAVWPPYLEEAMLKGRLIHK